MRNGSPTWEFRFGPINIKLDNLTQISFPRSEVQKRFIDNELTGDIRSNGLVNPLEVSWVLDNGLCQDLQIYKGNQRLQALKNLGYKEAPCYITIRGYQETEKFKEGFKKLLG